MNAKLIAPCLVAAALAATPCFADVNASGEVGYIPPHTSAPSNVTRAEVLAHLEQAQREGTLPPTAEGADTGAVAVSPSNLVPAQPMLAAR